MTPDMRTTAPTDLFSRGGEMGALMAKLDWASTPIGAVKNWPSSLRTAVSICLTSRFPMLVWWGPELVMLYNDAYRPVLGATKHPTAMGQRGHECWPEIWHIIGPMLESVLTEGKATWSDDQLLLLDRNGYVEECYFTFSYSPILDESGGVGGVFTAVTETTARVLGERRLRTLRELAATAAIATTATEACQLSARTLSENAADLPFALFYLLDETGQQLHLQAATGLSPGTPLSPKQINLATPPETPGRWPFAHALSGQIQQVNHLTSYFPPNSLDCPETALILPITSASSASPAGLLILGISPRQALNEEYQGFCELIAGHVASAIANALKLASERKRAEALAELDRAKTTFFSNVSHEFRTPLTLLLGPVEEILTEVSGPLTPQQREQLQIVHRNSLRLLKLVNSLLDFSRLEGSRLQATYEPIDLASFTADLASTFRSAIEKAGLRLLVNCPPLSAPAYVDREMWEKIVLNLLSNAFKFTFAGEIEVALCSHNNQIELSVRDTGTGIAPTELPNLGQRFHRVRGVRSRTHEGSGIGLALVQELLHLHGGTLQISSTLNQGSTFTAIIPAGCAHLASDRINPQRTEVPTASNANYYLQEIQRWLPDSDTQTTAIQPIGQSPTTPLILLADDNADMRDYVKRLLSPHYEIAAVANGEEALARSREQLPDLILSDVMMPGLGGFELLRELRANPCTKQVPIILLSARASEAARVEGLAAGADDYLIKPFSARELLARVEATLKMSQLRQQMAACEQALRLEAEAARQHIANILESITDTFVAVDSQWRYTYVNSAAAQLTGKQPAELLGQNFWEQFPTAVNSEFYQECIRAATEQVSIKFENCCPSTQRWFQVHLYPWGEGISIYSQDITDRKQAEAALRYNEGLYRAVGETLDYGIWVCDREGRNTYASESFLRLVGLTQAECSAFGWGKVLHPDEAEATIAKWQECVRVGGTWDIEHRYLGVDGNWHPILARGIPVKDENGDVICWVGINLDISRLKRTEQALRESQTRFERFMNHLPARAYIKDEAGCYLYVNYYAAEQFYNRPLAEVVGKTDFDLLPRETAQQLWENDLGVLASGNTLEILETIPDTAGDRYFISLKFPFLDASGRQLLAGMSFDISDRQRLQEALRSSEEQFRFLADSIPPIVWTATPEGELDYCNQRWFDYTGLEPTQGWGTELIVHPEDWQRTCQVWQTALATGQPYELEYRLRQAKDGSYRWHLSRGLPQCDCEGRIVKWYGTIADIDDRKQAEKTLRFLTTLDEQLRRLTDPEAVMEAVVSRVGEYLQVSRCLYGEWDDHHQAMCVRCEYCRGADSIQGLYLSGECGCGSHPDLLAGRTVVHCDVRVDGRSAMDESLGIRAFICVPLMKDQRCIGNLTVQMSDSPRQWTAAEVSLLEKVAEHTWLSVENARLYRQTQEALARAQQHATQLHGLTQAGLAINSALSVEATLEVVTEQARVLIGAHQAVTSLTLESSWEQALVSISLSEKYAAWRDYDAEPDGSGIYACVCSTNRSQRMTQAELEAHPHWRGFGPEAGKHPPMRGWLAAPLVGRDGGNIGLIQLSDKYEGEFTEPDEAILVQLAQMASVAIENTRLYEAQQQARSAAEVANRIKDEFLAVLSHELRSPLNPILGWVKLLRNRKLSEEKVAQALETIERNAKLQAQLIEDLLDVSRILRGKLALNAVAVDLAATVEAAIETVRLAADAKSIQVHLVCDSAVGKVLGDPNRLQQVVWNLVSNAVKFTDAGGQVEVHLQQVGTQAVVKVTDTGIGINSEFLPYVFDYFRQADSATTRCFGGLGLGLAIVRHLVELHGGTVKAESLGLGQGSTFMVMLPLLKPEESPERMEENTLDPPSLVSNPLRELRVLVVDDEVDTRELIVFILSENGAMVRSAASVGEALAIWSEWQPDFLLSDIAMPEADGYTLIQAIRGMPPERGGLIPAIALTAYAGEANQQQVLAAGFQRHLAKPMEPRELLEAIVALMEGTAQN
ncbi:MAG: PAS domain-containing protein [Actinomycetota bacterium]